VAKVIWGGGTQHRFEPWATGKGFTSPFVQNYLFWQEAYDLHGLKAHMDAWWPIVDNYSIYGDIPMFSVGMCLQGQDSNTVFHDIASGAYDDVWQYPVDLCADGSVPELYLRPGWEMNRPGWPWTTTNNTYLNFNRAFQRIYDVFHAQCTTRGVTGKVIYAPHCDSVDIFHWPALQEYCDVIGLDCYAPSGLTSVITIDMLLKRGIEFSKPTGFGESGVYFVNQGISATWWPEVVAVFEDNPGAIFEVCAFADDSRVEPGLDFETFTADSDAFAAGMHAVDATQAAISPPAPAGVPRNLRIVARTSTGVMLAWDPPNSGAVPTKYRAQYKLTSSNVWIDGPSTSTLRISVSGLLPNLPYDFRVYVTHSKR